MNPRLACARLFQGTLLLGLGPGLMPCTGLAAGVEDALDEVLITSGKELQSLRETPAAVTALTAETLVASGITDLRAAQMLVPSARFQAEGNNTEIFIRGVGTGLDLPNVEPSVGFIFAGAYLPREGSSAALFDIAQIEALPGPQGTLYGRSAIGGTVSITPRRPAHDSSGTALLEAGNYGAAHVSYAQNVPLSSSVALRVALDEERRGGFNTSGADARHDFGARLSLLVDRTPQFSAHLWSQWAEKDGHPADLVNKGTDPASFAYLENAFLRTNPWDDTRTGALAALAPFGQPQAETQRYRMFMSGGELAWQLGALKLTWLPSYFYLDSAPDYWLGGIRARLTAHYNQIAQELRLASDPTNRLSWMTGLYLYRVRNGGALSLFTNQPFAFRQSSIAFNELQNAALFAQATLHLPERSRLVAGARDSLDWRKAHGFAPDPVGSGAFNFDREYRHVDWKLGLEHDTAGGTLLYASVQTGYKPGSYNEVPASATFDNAVKPSNLLAWSAGWKARYFGDALQLDGEAFYYAYKDLAIQAYDINAPFNPVFNAQKITIPGLQLDSRYRFPDSTRVRLSLGYTHARNRAFTTPAGADFSGLQPPYAPDWTVLGGLDREFPFATGRFRARLDLRYESAWFADYVHNPGVRQHAAAKTDASLTWESRAGWTLGAWVKNLSNEAVLAATAAAGIPGPATAYLESPRTFGVRATLEF